MHDPGRGNDHAPLLKHLLELVYGGCLERPRYLGTSSPAGCAHKLMRVGLGRHSYIVCRYCGRPPAELVRLAVDEQRERCRGELVRVLAERARVLQASTDACPIQRAPIGSGGCSAPLEPLGPYVDPAPAR